jgi:CubicO group peptidase (beta-lactamase class C family)
MRNIKLQFILLMFFLSIKPNNLLGQTTNLFQVDSLLIEAFNQGSFNGNAVVVKNNEIIYSASFGYTDASKKAKLSLAVRFNIGSIYKEFSAVALMILVEEGKLSLDNSISKYIPSLPEWSRKIKIKHLLQYTSGLPNLNWDTIKSDADILNDLKNIDSLQFEPGTSYFYNNNDLSVRQFIIERVSGISFNQFVQENMFEPLGMTSSITNPTNQSENIALAFSNAFENDKIESRFSGVIYVTAHDLLKWEQSLKDFQLISKKSMNILAKSFNGHQSAIGNAEFIDGNWVSHLHNGESRNFEAILYSNYQKNYTIILLGNNKNRKLFELTDNLIDILASKD